ncbi:hypothetical protein EPR50_G00068320 [Perca flavescens]|uniref:Uncharacterized protein n=1 Tax=Perca flavescens TaxID=8167 RepID=A0A484DA10_PERFV|nr:hypothetical protein EPR50_G00068320 [Perca flavescens]
MLLDQQEMEQESGTNLKNLFRGSGRSPGIRNLKFPPSIEDLQDYQRYHEGSCPTSKQLENAQSKVSRVRNIDGIQKYTAHLQSPGKTITTAHFYLRTIQQFLKYFRETLPAQSHLTAMDVVSMLRPVTKCITDTTRNVVLHQLAVKSHKKARIISCEDMKRCQEGATLRIPELLDALEENHTPSPRYEAAEAHRPGDDGFVISIREHKTNKSFGVAWAEIRLKGSPNFTDLRTAVSAHVKNNLLSGSRRYFAFV